MEVDNTTIAWLLAPNGPALAFIFLTASMNHTLPNFLLLAHLASCLYMVGLIWFVQVVHYPLFRHVGAADFSLHARRHRTLTTWVVGPPMLLEGLTGALLLYYRPAGIASWAVWSGMVLLGVIWGSTAFLQVPCHRSLEQSFDFRTLWRLISTNWLRTACWTLRGGLVLGMMWQVTSVSNSSTSVSPLVPLKVGDHAPDFRAVTHDGRQISLADYRGKKWLVLFFYPKDGTSVCTQEACAFRDSYEQFVAAGADVIGISSDDEASHRAFAERHQLSFPLISDTDGSLRRKFAVPKTLGLLPGRVTYVIDAEGVIQLVFSAQFASDEHVQKALAVVHGG